MFKLKRYKVGDPMKSYKIILAIVLSVSLFVGATLLYNHLMSEENESNIAMAKTKRNTQQESAFTDEDSNSTSISESEATSNIASSKVGNEIGDFAYDFSISDELGNSVTLSDYRGKHVIVSFWIYGCPACYAEFPEYQKLHDKLEQDQIEDVKLIKIYINPENASTPNISEIRNQLDDSGYTFPTYWDKGDVATNYGIYYVPHTFVIDENGLITASIVGTTSYDALAELVGLED